MFLLIWTSKCFLKQALKKKIEWHAITEENLLVQSYSNPGKLLLSLALIDFIQGFAEEIERIPIAFKMSDNNIDITVSYKAWRF